MRKSIPLALLILAVTVLPLSDVSWAKPKGTYLLCKCTCTAEDELGKTHYGPSNGYWFTTSGDQCLGKKCKVGNLEGSTRDCLFTEHSENVHVPPGSVQGFFSSHHPRLAECERRPPERSCAAVLRVASPLSRQTQDQRSRQIQKRSDSTFQALQGPGMVPTPRVPEHQSRIRETIGRRGHA